MGTAILSRGAGMVEKLLAELHEQIRDLRQRLLVMEQAIDRIERWIAIEDYRKTSVILTRGDVIRSTLLWIFIFIAGFGAGDALEKLR